MSEFNQQKSIGRKVHCKRCGRAIMNPKNIKIWERNGGFGHGCAEKIAIEQAKDKALHQSMDTFVGLSIDQILAQTREKELPLERGIFSEV